MIENRGEDMNQQTHKKREKNKQKWIKRVSQWQASGMNAASWCRENEIKYVTFLYWRSRLQVEHQAVPIEASSFIEITEVPSPTAPSGIEIEIQDVSIRLSKNFDSCALERCLNLIMARTC